jgi:hypothetical protein
MRRDRVAYCASIILSDYGSAPVRSRFSLRAVL